MKKIFLCMKVLMIVLIPIRGWGSLLQSDLEKSGFSSNTIPLRYLDTDAYEMCSDCEISSLIERLKERRALMDKPLKYLLLKYDCSGPQYYGAVPQNLDLFKSLVILDISGHQLSGPFSPAIGGLVNLKRLDLSCNELSDSLPPEIGNLSGLEYLDLGYNKLSHALP